MGIVLEHTEHRARIHSHCDVKIKKKNVNSLNVTTYTCVRLQAAIAQDVESEQHRRRRKVKREKAHSCTQNLIWSNGVWMWCLCFWNMAHTWRARTEDGLRLNNNKEPYAKCSKNKIESVLDFLFGTRLSSLLLVVLGVVVFSILFFGRPPSTLFVMCVRAYELGLIRSHYYFYHLI